MKLKFKKNPCIFFAILLEPCLEIWRFFLDFGGTGYLLLVLASLCFWGCWLCIAKKLYEQLKVLKSSSLRDCL